MTQRRSTLVALNLLLLGSLSLGLARFNPASATEDPTRKDHVYTTKCCKGYKFTGSSNDCTSGSGQCTDHGCATGEIESSTDCYLP